MIMDSQLVIIFKNGFDRGIRANTSTERGL
jgi:hypothetical protein